MDSRRIPIGDRAARHVDAARARALVQAERGVIAVRVPDDVERRARGTCVAGPRAAVDCSVRRAGARERSLFLLRGASSAVATAPGDTQMRVSAEGRSLQECNLNRTSGGERMLMLDE